MLLHRVIARGNVRHPLQEGIQVLLSRQCMTSCRHARAMASRAHVGVVVPQTTKHSVFAADGTVWTVADLDLQAPITHFEMGVTGNVVYGRHMSSVAQESL